MKKELRIGNLVYLNGELYEVESGSFSEDNIADISVLEFVKPIPLTEEWLLKFGFENWGEVIDNEHERYTRYVLYNIIEGTSNFEVHYVKSNYGGELVKEFVFSIDQNDRLHFARSEFVHHLQNCFALTGKELELKNT